MRGSIATSAAAGPVGIGKDLLDRLAGLLLEVEVDRRRHLEAAAEDPLGAVLGHELVGDVVDEVRCRPARAGQADVLGLRQRPRVRLLELGGRDPTLVVELLQHVGAPLPRCRGMLHRVVQRGARRDTGEQCRLGQRQLRGALAAEVGPGRLEDAVGAVPEVDRVEVRGEDPVLRPPLRQLPGERRLAHLARDRLVVAAVRVLDVLLRDRRSALDDRLVADVLPRGAEDAADVDPVVLEEPLVLDGDDRLLHDRGDLVGLHEHAALVAAQDREHPPLAGLVRGGVEDRVDVTPRVRGVERAELAADRRHEAVAEGHGREREEHEHERQEPRLPDPAALRRRLRTSSKPHCAQHCSPGWACSGRFRRSRGRRAARRRSGRSSSVRALSRPRARPPIPGASRRARGVSHRAGRHRPGRRPLWRAASARP